MAGVLKARDAGGILRTITAAKVRDAGGVLRTLQFIRVRDAGGVLREVFTAGGGGGGSNPASIAPGYQQFSGKGTTKSATYTAMSSGSAPTSYNWGLLDGDGRVATGAASATATLSVMASAGEDNSSTFFCDMVIDGTTYRATCILEYFNTLGGGGVQQ